MNILACYNIKGGVGKTAAAVNLSYLAAREGARTLVWDLDPQGSASFYFRIKPDIKGGGKALIKGKHELSELIKGTDYDLLDLLPADFSYRHLDLLLDDVKKKNTQRLRKLLRPLAQDYDYIFLDCPPSLSLLSDNVFRAADALLIPTIPTTLSLRALQQTLDYRNDHGLDALKLLPFFSMVDRRKHLHSDVADQPPEDLGSFLPTAIPYSSDIEHMGIKRKPLAEYAGNSRAGAAYAALWLDIKGCL